MAVSVTDLLRVTAVFKYGGIYDVVNRFHFIVNAVPTPNDDPSLLEDVGELLGEAYANIEAYQPSGLDVDHIEVYNVLEDFPHGLGSWGAGYTGGTAASDAMPLDDCALVLWSTSRKRVQGRTYLGPFIEAQHADSRWSGTLISAIGSWSAAIRNNTPMSNGTELEYRVWSATHNLALVPNTIRVQPIVAQQERRKIGRGS